MSTAGIVAVVLGVVMVAFCGWAWLMNRLDERRHQREDEAFRSGYQGRP